MITWHQFDENRIEFLRLVADNAEFIAAQHLTDENFHRLVNIAYEGGVITAQRLAVIGRRDPATASRWINKRATPGTFAQEAILKLIAIEARRLRDAQGHT